MKCVYDWKSRHSEKKKIPFRQTASHMCVAQVNTACIALCKFENKKAAGGESGLPRGAIKHVLVRSVEKDFNANRESRSPSLLFRWRSAWWKEYLNTCCWTPTAMTVGEREISQRQRRRRRKGRMKNWSPRRHQIQTLTWISSCVEWRFLFSVSKMSTLVLAMMRMLWLQW